MPFTPVDLAITEVLETDFITDFRIISNANFSILKAAFEDLVNNLEIDANGITIGTSTPINSITTDVLVMQSTGFQFNKTGPILTIASLTKNGSDQSVFNVDILTVDATSNFGELLTADSLSITNAATFNDTATFNGVLEAKSGVISSHENVPLTASLVGSNGEATLTLTSTSREDIYVTLSLDTTLISGTTIAGGWSGQYLKLLVDFDATNPPAEGQSFNIHIVDFLNSAPTSVISALDGEPKTLQITANTNQSTATPIFINGGTAGSITIETDPGVINLAKYGHCASLIYHIDATTQDRLIVKSLHNLILA